MTIDLSVGMADENWIEAAGGAPMTSRYTQQRIAARDHCVAIVRTCPQCHSRYVATPEQPEHGCQTKDAA